MEEWKQNAEAGKMPEGEVVLPRGVEEMSKEEFEEYIQSVKEGVGEVQAERSGRAEPADDVPYMTFATKEDLQAYQDKTIGKRLRELREKSESEQRPYEELLKLAQKRYRTDTPQTALEQLFAELEEQDANLQYRDETERLAEEIRSDWERQADVLKKLAPEFDLVHAFFDPEFYRRVVEEHASIAEAYLSVRKKEVPQRRIREVGNASNGIGGGVNTDVNSMSDREFAEYIRKIKGN